MFGLCNDVVSILFFSMQPSHDTQKVRDKWFDPIAKFAAACLSLGKRKFNYQSFLRFLVNRLVEVQTLRRITFCHDKNNQWARLRRSQFWFRLLIIILTTKHPFSSNNIRRFIGSISFWLLLYQHSIVS